MKYNILTLNQIASHGLHRFPSVRYSVGKSVDRPDAILVLSTPNLGYWLNRLLLLCGISPLFLENSAERKLGRFTRLLGQGNQTEGHIRLFTYRALRELVELLGYEIVSVTPTYVWRFPPDLVLSRFSRSLAATNVFLLRQG